jgi:hypothetical protein
MCKGCSEPWQCPLSVYQSCKAAWPMFWHNSERDVEVHQKKKKEKKMLKFIKVLSFKPRLEQTISVARIFSETKPKVRTGQFLKKFSSS